MIKINFTDMDRGFDKENNFLTDIIKKNFTDEICISDNPDFLFFSCIGTKHQSFKDCVKIFFTGEPVVPNFNECDYAIGFDDINFQQRYCKRPFWLYSEYPTESLLTDEQLVKRKFCNFIYSNETRGTAIELRKKFALELMKYKDVDCPGKVLNNMQNAITPRNGNWYEGKMEFIKDYKFTIAFENCKVSGYTTEKLEDPFLAHSIPIYWGNPDVTKYFNENAFICANGYEDDFSKIIERIIYLDNHDEEYIKMVRETPMIIRLDDKNKLEKFIVSIIEKGNHPFEKDPVGCAKKMTIPELSGKQLTKLLIGKMKNRLLNIH